MATDNLKCTITTTDSGSIKCQIRGDATPKQAMLIISKELEVNGYNNLYWPSLYFGTKKKEWPKKKEWKPAPQPEEEFKSVITEEDPPWML